MLARCPANTRVHRGHHALETSELTFRRWRQQPDYAQDSPAIQLLAARSRRQLRLRPAALRIDRRAHLERAWQDQKEQEAARDAARAAGQRCGPSEIATLAQLEAEVEAAGSSIVVVAFYSRSCGACKQMMQHYRDLCKEANDQRAGVVFLVHNVRDDFDDVTHIARLYRIKSVPCFAFFSGGAIVRSMPMPDTRIDPGAIRRVMGQQAGCLKAALREMLFRDTPSARR